jgi:hypothetical protein
MRRLALVMLLAGCKDPLQADVEMFCNATTGTDWKTFIDVGPYAAEHAKSNELKQLLLKPAQGSITIWEFADQFRELMKKAGVEQCRTLEVIVPPKPR